MKNKNIIQKEKMKQILLLFDMIYNKKRIIIEEPSLDFYTGAVYFGQSAINPGSDIWTCIDNKREKSDSLSDKALFVSFCTMIIHTNCKITNEYFRYKNIALLLKEYKIIEKYLQGSELPDLYDMYNELRRCRESE